jgi:hypothetical protein
MSRVVYHRLYVRDIKVNCEFFKYFSWGAYICLTVQNVRNSTNDESVLSLTMSEAVQSLSLSERRVGLYKFFVFSCL